MKTQYWKINDNMQIEALTDFWDIKKGQVGGMVKSCTKLPAQEKPSWLGNYIELGSDVKLGHYVKLGNDVELGNYVKLGNGVELTDNYVELTNQGDKKRSVLFHTKDKEVLVSVGCQVSIPYSVFLERIQNATETNTISTDKYKKMIPIYNMIVRRLTEDFIDGGK